MAAGVEVPLHLLEDMSRLLEYLDCAGGRDGMHFHESGHSLQLERGTALWELKSKIRQLRGWAVEAYLLTVGGVTEGERRGLEEWVAAGRSAYDNPFLVCDESGRPMDFINGCRLAIEMDEEHARFFGAGPDGIGNGGWDGEEPPF